VARIGHPLLAAPGVTPERYAACDHVVASRNDDFAGPLDQALAKLGLVRRIRVVVPGYPDAMRVARRTDLIALAPRSCLGNRLTSLDDAASGLESFELPVATPEIAISAMWHPRVDADPAHCWLRETVMSVCRAAYPRR
jgi:DNA-binding transcriptional LysR family regulator